RCPGETGVPAVCLVGKSTTPGVLTPLHIGDRLVDRALRPRETCILRASQCNHLEHGDRNICIPRPWLVSPSPAVFSLCSLAIKYQSNRSLQFRSDRGMLRLPVQLAQRDRVHAMAVHVVTSLHVPVFP